MHLIFLSNFLTKCCLQTWPCVVTCLFTHYTLCKTLHPPLCLSVSRSAGVTDKELAFMHEEGIRDPSVCLCEDKEANREHTSGEIISRSTDALKHRQDY